MDGRVRSMLAASLVSLTGGVVARAQNSPPSVPVITEPQPTRLINPEDLHMEVAGFSDPDPGDGHACTDWEVWTITTGQPGGPLGERVWITSCIGGIEKLHSHLADGQFVGLLEGRGALDPETTYAMLTRHKDDSGDLATQWSGYARQDFTTGSLEQIFPMELEDALTSPTPTLREDGGAPTIVLPGGSQPARIRVESPHADLVLEFVGDALSQTTQLLNPPGLADHETLRVIVQAGDAPLNLPRADITFTDDDGRLRRVYLPALSLAPMAAEAFWIAENGSTFAADLMGHDPEFAVLRRGAPVPWTVDPEFRVDVVATGFQLPVSIAFVPQPGPNPNDPFYYVAELYGAIKVVRNNGVVSDYATNLLNFDPTGLFPGSGEQGLADILVDPATGDVFATLVYSSVPGVEDAPHYPRIVRFQSSEDGLTALGQTTIKEMPGETMGQSHQISSISFGPDGYLYVHVGDGFFYLTSQNLNFYRGKILRMTKDGQPLPDNPHFNGPPFGPEDFVWSRGLRNPFGGAWRQADAGLYFVENGPSVDRFAKIERGRNFAFSGNDASMSMFAIYNWAPAVAPVNIEFVQAGTFNGSGFPSTRFDHAYVTQSGGTWGTGPQYNSKSITEFVLDPDGDLLSGPTTIAKYNGAGKATCAALSAGPDGLYFSDLYKDDSFDTPVARGANILRLSYIGGVDCNANGQADSLDIATQSSMDCNSNTIPDECDIGSGRSEDCNNNGVPDECDANVAFTRTYAEGAGLDQLLGSAASLIGRVRLTDDADRQVGTLLTPWVSPVGSSPTSAGFDVWFDFQISGQPGGAGLGFFMLGADQSSSDAPFGPEGPGPAAGPMGLGVIGVQFDTQPGDNPGTTEPPASIQIIANGQTLASESPPFTIADNQVRRAFVTFRNQQLTLRVLSPGGDLRTIFDRVPIAYSMQYPVRFALAAATVFPGNEHWIDNLTFLSPGPGDTNANGLPDACESRSCDTIDFNNDGAIFDPTDIEAFLSVFSEGPCVPAGATCNDIDFNNDGSLFDPRDIDAFLSVFSEGSCP